MKKTKPKPQRKPKPVMAWAVFRDGKLWGSVFGEMCVFDTLRNARASKIKGVVRVRITVVEPKRRRKQP